MVLSPQACTVAPTRAPSPDLGEASVGLMGSWVVTWWDGAMASRISWISDACVIWAMVMREIKVPMIPVIRSLSSHSRSQRGLSECSPPRHPRVLCFGWLFCCCWIAFHSLGSETTSPASVSLLLPTDGPASGDVFRAHRGGPALQGGCRESASLTGLFALRCRQRESSLLLLQLF